MFQVDGYREKRNREYIVLILSHDRPFYKTLSLIKFDLVTFNKQVSLILFKKFEVSASPVRRCNPLNQNHDQKWRSK